MTEATVRCCVMDKYLTVEVLYQYLVCQPACYWHKVVLYVVVTETDQTSFAVQSV